MPHHAKEVLEGLVVIEPAQLHLRRVADFAVVDKRELEEAIERKRAELAERQAKKLESWLEKLIADYRTERELLLKRR
jgi:predicted RNase H-like nuclease (RuvC/YqgF family)